MRDNLIRHGFGVQEYPDGSKYSGGWVDDNITGKGKMYRSDGDIYDGEWRNNKAHGMGTYI